MLECNNQCCARWCTAKMK